MSLQLAAKKAVALSTPNLECSSSVMWAQKETSTVLDHVGARRNVQPKRTLEPPTPARRGSGSVHARSSQNGDGHGREFPTELRG